MENEWKHKMKEFAESSETEPLEGHFERFESRLNKSIPLRQKRKSSNLLWIGWIAASLTGIVLGIAYFNSGDVQPVAEQVNTEVKTPSLSDYSLEAGMKEAFYTAQLAKKELDGKWRNNKDLSDVFEVLDRLNQESEVLNNKLKVNFHNEHVIQAILENYRLRLEIMEKIQKIIQVKNRIKNTDNEKELI